MAKNREVLEEYSITADNVEAEIKIYRSRKKFVPWYEVHPPEIGEGTQALLDSVRSRAISELRVNREDLLKMGEREEIKNKFKDRIRAALKKEMGEIGSEQLEVLVGTLLHNTVGLGTVEILLEDPQLEEIVINNAEEPIWVYHRNYGWLKTNVSVGGESKIYNYASKIGRRVGREITTLNPLMDAHMLTGDRVNATLFPISTEGNTITIRKFRRSPWTIVELIENNTISAGLAAFLWECMEYELSLIISGGTASGKCVSSSTRIPLANGKRPKAKKIVEEILDEKETKRVEDGFRAQASDLEVLTLNKDLKIEPAEVSHVWKLKAPEYLYRIETYGGASIDVTPEHPFFRLNEEGELIKTRADKLREESQIALPRKLVNKSEEIDLRDKIISNLERGYALNEFNLPNSVELKDFNKWTVKSWKYGENKVPIKIARQFKSEFKHVFTRNGNKVFIPKEVTSELTELIGHLIGDGHVGEGYIEFKNSNDFLLNRVKDLFESVFEVKAQIKKYKSGRVRVYSSVLSNIFERAFQIPKGKKSRLVRIPDFVFKLDKKRISALLKALFDTDGHINPNKSELEYGSASKGLIKDMMFLLKRVGIVSRFDVRGENQFRLRIYDPNQFKKEVGFNHPSKMQTLKEVVEKDTASKIDSIPKTSRLFTKLKKKLDVFDREVAGSAGLSRRCFGRIRNGNRVPSRKTFKKLITAFKDIKGNLDGGRERSKELNILEKLGNSDVFWGKIKKIEKIEPEEEWVYDFTVPGTHDFVAGESGDFIVHNSTSLNALMEFIPANHRVISIEQTKELRLPDFLHWVPTVTREPNPEGKGEVSMLDLLVNSLRMRPDRIVVGEVRRQREAEVLFEAMHTGHSIYATLHADTAPQTIRRLTNPPISIPVEEIQTLPLIAVMYRHRRKGIRRFFQVAEIIEGSRGDLNILYEWDASEDKIKQENRSTRVFRTLKLHTGLTDEEIRQEINEKERILKWMVDKEVHTVNKVGKIVNFYYSNKSRVAKAAKKGKDPDEMLG